jgi:GH25 family lysozyme M1 (1,4-beta-N-acetylmuramidase)
MTKRKILIAAVLLLSMVLVSLVLAALLLQRPQPIPGPAPETTQTVPETTTLPPPTENVFTPMDFAYEGDYLTCVTDESWLGVDVSSYQKDVDWEQVKEAGFEFAMLRVGFRGYGQTGSLNPDKYAKQNYENATAAGLKVGVYFFSQAISVEEAVEEAEYVLQLIEGWDLQMPVAYDWECLADDYRTVVVDSRTLTDCVKAFCDTIKAAGYDPMIYCARYIVQDKLYMEELADYALWYSDFQKKYLRSEFRVDMWQYSSSGRIDGITGPVDLNMIFLENSVFSKYFD